MKTQSLKLSEIVTTAGTQIRAKIDAEAVSDYAEAMTDGAKFPAVVVFHDGSEYILADGFHRVMAATRNGFKDILAEIHKGTKSDALKFALTANTTHGIKRTNADKRRSVELALAEWPKLSSREISRVCAVSHQSVENIRSEMSNFDNSESRITKDGKSRKVKPKSAQLVGVEEDGDEIFTPIDPVPQTSSERINAQVEAAVKAHDEKQLSPEIKHLVFMLELNRDNCDGLASCVGRDGCDDDTLKDAIKKLKELAILLTVYRMSQKTEQKL